MLGFELRALCLLGEGYLGPRPSLLLLLFFRKGLALLPSHPQTLILQSLLLEGLRPKMCITLPNKLLKQGFPTLHSLPFLYVSTASPIIHCLVFMAFSKYYKMTCKSSNFVLFENCFGNSMFFAFLCKFGSQLSAVAHANNPTY
jgi:hypothetical protein